MVADNLDVPFRCTIWVYNLSMQFECTIWDDLGVQFGCAILGSTTWAVQFGQYKLGQLECTIGGVQGNLAVQFGCIIQASNLSVQFGCTIWVYNLGIKFGCTIWAYNLGIQIGCTIWLYNFNLSVQFGCTILQF